MYVYIYIYTCLFKWRYFEKSKTIGKIHGNSHPFATQCMCLSVHVRMFRKFGNHSDDVWKFRPHQNDVYMYIHVYVSLLSDDVSKVRKSLWTECIKSDARRNDHRVVIFIVFRTLASYSQIRARWQGVITQSKRSWGSIFVKPHEIWFKKLSSNCGLVQIPI